mgnify:CR=1 FL=1
MTRLKTLKTRELAKKLKSKRWVVNRSTDSDRGKLSDCDIMAVKNGKLMFLNVVVVETGFRRKDVSDSSYDLTNCVTNATESSLGMMNSDSLYSTGYHAACKVQGDETVSWALVGRENTTIIPSTNMKNLSKVIE